MKCDGAPEPKNTTKTNKEHFQKQRPFLKIHTLGGYRRVVRIHTNIADHMLILRLLGEQEGVGRTKNGAKA